MIGEIKREINSDWKFSEKSVGSLEIIIVAPKRDSRNANSFWEVRLKGVYVLAEALGAH